jgi:hypothetical protein
MVLGNPKAWLGTAYHEVLAAKGARESGATATEVWEQAVSTQYERALAHPLNHRFGAPERWPAYHLIRAMALTRAQEATGEGDTDAACAGTPLGGHGAPSDGHERWLTAADSRLVGRPDLLRRDAVIDYKTGEVFEHGEDDVVKASYVRQLQLYAFLAKSSTGTWPTLGVLLPMDGSRVEIALEPSECERVAEEALELLSSYNTAITNAADVFELASPSPATCKWCPFQLVCPAFWSAANSSWSDESIAAALGGEAEAAAWPIHGRSAFALGVNVDEGTEPDGLTELAPLRVEIHGVLPLVQHGTRIRVVGLGRRADGTVTPTKRTVISRVQDLPRIVVAQNANGTAPQAP